MSSAPPNALGAVAPGSGDVQHVVSVMVWAAMSLTRTEFGSVTMAWVTPAGVGVVRKSFATARLYSGNPFAVPGGGGGPPILKGTVLAAAMWGGPATWNEPPWIRTAVPCGIVAIRTTVAGSSGSVVSAALQPDARLQVDRAAILRSLICCR